jgi:hypothetical protein
VFSLAVVAASRIGLTLVVFFGFTFPANRRTRDWTVLPDTWEALRRQWEYSHAVSAGLYFVAFIALIISLLAGCA